jgi:hypothetical protein
MMEAFEHSSLEGSNLTGAIDALLEDIQESILNVILAEHAATQVKIDAVFSEADAAVKTASSTWTQAAGKWAAVSSCMEAEKGLSAEYHKAAADVEAKKQIEKTKKSAMDAQANISATWSKRVFTCNAAEGECSPKLNVLRQWADAALHELLETYVPTQVEQYEAAKSEYDTARKNREDAEAVRDGANTAHYTRHVTCSGDTTAAEDYFCDAAAVAEKSACVEIEKFQGVVAKAQGTNNELSHSDRASEYSTIMKTMCLLREVKGESVDCTQTHDIASAPGYKELDFKEKDAESLVCHENDKRTLSEFTWTRPERTEAGPPAVETSYEKVASQAMDLRQMKLEWCTVPSSLAGPVWISQSGCKALAALHGKTFGGCGYDAVGVWSKTGCYSYTSGPWATCVYYGQIKGPLTDESQLNDLDFPKYRPSGSSGDLLTKSGCQALASEEGKSFGGCGSPAAGPWSDVGCYGYKEGWYKTCVFFGTSYVPRDLIDESELNAVSGDEYRPGVTADLALRFGRTDK